MSCKKKCLLYDTMATNLKAIFLWFIHSGIFLEMFLEAEWKPVRYDNLVSSTVTTLNRNDVGGLQEDPQCPKGA